MTLVCSVTDCGLRVNARGMCKKHYSRWCRSGDTDLHPLIARVVPLDVLAWRALSQVVVTQRGCWEFQGSRNKQGYGQLQSGERTAAGNRRPRQTHRIVYEFIRGPIPAGLVLDHVACDNPPCCNPWHVKPVTHRENVLRGTAPSARHARQTHCKRGHAFDERNTYHTKHGGRACRACARGWWRDPEAMRATA